MINFLPDIYKIMFCLWFVILYIILLTNNCFLSVRLFHHLWDRAYILVLVYVLSRDWIKLVHCINLLHFLIYRDFFFLKTSWEIHYVSALWTLCWLLPSNLKRDLQTAEWDLNFWQSDFKNLCVQSIFKVFIGQNRKNIWLDISALIEHAVNSLAHLIWQHVPIWYVNKIL